MDHSAFTLSVSRELEVSLANSQSRYFDHGGIWQSFDTIDLLWAGADAFGQRCTGIPASSFPLAGTVRCSGRLIGTAVDHRGLPPVYGDADLSLDLGSLTGKASFASPRMTCGLESYLCGKGSLYHPISVADNAIGYNALEVSRVADF